LLNRSADTVDFPVVLQCRPGGNDTEPTRRCLLGRSGRADHLGGIDQIIAIYVRVIVCGLSAKFTVFGAHSAFCIYDAAQPDLQSPVLETHPIGQGQKRVNVFSLSPDFFERFTRVNP
jgi:hypothetical protein